jgi:hypothetical protein
MLSLLITSHGLQNNVGDGFTYADGRPLAISLPCPRLFLYALPHRFALIYRWS